MSDGASARIDRLIADLPDWRGPTLAAARKAILSADRAIVEEWKWMGSPVWERDGILVVGNAHKDKVKLTFASGAQLPDPRKLFNNGLGGGRWRAIDLREGDKVDAAGLKALVRAAIAFNQAKRAAKAKPPTKAKARPKAEAKAEAKAKAKATPRNPAASRART